MPQLQCRRERGKDKWNIHSTEILHAIETRHHMPIKIESVQNSKEIPHHVSEYNIADNPVSFMSDRPEI